MDLKKQTRNRWWEQLDNQLRQFFGSKDYRTFNHFFWLFIRNQPQLELQIRIYRRFLQFKVYK